MRKVEELAAEEGFGLLAKMAIKQAPAIIRVAL